MTTSNPRDFGGSGMTEDLYQWIVENIPKGSTIVEFGAGDVSTRFLSERYNLISVEDQSRWIGRWPRAKYINAPITNGWYDIEVLKKHLPDLDTISLVIIDGPSGSNFRGNVLKHMDILPKRCPIVIDDTHREPERSIANEVFNLIKQEQPDTNILTTPQWTAILPRTIRRSEVFRFDDVCINADMELIGNITDFIFSENSTASVILAISPLVHDMSKAKNPVAKQRIFPQILNAYSDKTVFYNVDKAGIPNLEKWSSDKRVKFASHGLIHMDHRLLNVQEQQMSIAISSGLINYELSKYSNRMVTDFVPPFNKWNEDTEHICINRGLTLCKFEDGWRCVEYEPSTMETKLWYLHARELTLKRFVRWYQNVQ